MTIDRRQEIIIVIAVTVLSFTGILVTLAWMSPLTVTPMASENLSITDAEFDEDYLTLTVRNICKYPTTISKIIINQTSAHVFPVCEKLSAYGQASIGISFNWTSGSIYQVGVKTAYCNQFWCTAVAP
jgi:hypothetical protein